MGIESRELSRSKKYVDNTHMGIDTGSFQRIADGVERMAASSEKMAANYTSLQNEVEMYKKWYREGNEDKRKLYRRISSLQGVITRQRNKLKAK